MEELEILAVFNPSLSGALGRYGGWKLFPLAGAEQR